MTDFKTAARSRIKRVSATLGMIAAGFAIAFALTCLLSPVIGPPMVRYNNAHSRGKIPQGDAWLVGAELIAAATTVSGLALAIIYRKRKRIRNLSIGVFFFGVTAIIAFLLLYLMIAGILRD